MIFTPQGLVLGAGTILVPAEGIRKLESLNGREQQVLALLSAAYNTAVEPKRIVLVDGGHFAAYTGPGFAVTSTAARDWFVQHLGG